MKIIPIFASQNKEGLFAVQNGDEAPDELSKLTHEWLDIEYLDTFFREHEKDLKSGYYGKISIQQAIDLTTKEAMQLFRKLRHLASDQQSGGQLLQTAFEPLRPGDTSGGILKKGKAKGAYKRWLRIYAIKISDNTFIVSGGAIKLTETMNEREHLLKELRKLDQLRDFLKDEGVFDQDSFYSIEI